MLDQIKMGENDVGHMKKNDEKSWKEVKEKKGRGEMKNEEGRIKMNKFYGLMVVWDDCESALKNDSIFIVEEEWLKRIEEVKGSN